MSSRKRNAPDANRSQRRRNNLNDVIIISDDESEDGLVTDSPLYKPLTPRRWTKRPILAGPQNSDMRGSLPSSKRKKLLHGQSSNSTDHLCHSTLRNNSTDQFQPIFVNNFPQPPPRFIPEQIPLSQYRLENPYSKSILPELNQCGWCWQKIPEDHPNYMPLMTPLPLDSSTDDDTDEALDSYDTINNIDSQKLKDWWNQSFNTPPHRG